MSYTTQYFFIKKGYIRTARFKTWEIKTFIICEKNEVRYGTALSLNIDRYPWRVTGIPP